MSERDRDPDEPRAAAQDIERICVEFERAWRDDSQPRIEQYLARATDQRSQLLYELVRLELELRRRGGEKVGEEGYYDRFPDDAETLKEVFGAWRETEAFAAHSQPPRVPGSKPRTARPADKYLAAGDRIGKYVVQRWLGKGSFGIVYLARHPQLDTDVAIKVPRAGRFESAEQLEAFLEDARHAASLRHPGIVVVHDVDQDGERPFIVQEYLPGGDLKQALAARLYAPDEAAEMVAAIADAVSFAHRQGVYHRDLKPGNILLDAGGQPRVTDFGLALRERSRLLHKGEICGTPTYMAPEQVRGETHRLDGRCDIWGLGVILYLMLAGRLPFTQREQRALFDDILFTDPPPLRQIDPELPAELERICARCLSKRMADRYATASDLADDLQHWRRAENGSAGAHGAQQQSRIVPKFLRAFDREDRDFFLDLLPDPKDREGLPEAVRFWKTRIEEPDADQTFAVGLLYGPSGCGKSSLVKAGLLPRLSSAVSAVYVESTAEETELRLLTEIRKQVPEVPQDLELPELLASLREGEGLPRGSKLLIVLDQFEQWLHARHNRSESRLIEALRQCDGGHVQALVMVRDDFWMAATRFLQAVEVELVQGHNVEAVDRFDVRHARKVLTLLGQAYGALPEAAHEMNAEQHAFLDRAIASLVEDGRIVSVRLSVFAHMVRSKPWTLATLRKAEDAGGIGLAFLEETFHSPTSSPKHRLYAGDAQRVLRELLPPPGVTIKGTMKSYAGLRKAARCDPADFEQVIGILDRELSLIMPTDPSGDLSPAGTAQPDPRERYYQLTHDYLVPALQDWLTRTQRASRSERARQLLGELAASWNRKRESRRLPTFGEWLMILGWTDRSTRTVPQQQMLRAASRRFATRAALFVAVTAFAVIVARESIGRLRTSDLVAQLQSAELSEVDQVLERLEPYSRWAQPALRRALAQNDVPLDDDASESEFRRRLNLALSAVGSDPSRAPFVFESLFRVRPDDVQRVARFLIPYQAKVTEDLWDQLDQISAQAPEQPLRAASALALLDAQSAQWPSRAETISKQLISARPLQLSAWTTQLFPVRHHLLPSLLAAFGETSLDEAQRRNLAEVVAAFAGADPPQLLIAARAARADQLEPLIGALATNRDRAVAILRTGWSVDGALDGEVTAWDSLPAETIAEIESLYAGTVTPSAAIAVMVPDAAAQPLLGVMAAAGYRPTSLRPYQRHGEQRFAVTWTRDGRAWRHELNLTAAELTERDRTWRAEGWELTDMALYGDAAAESSGERFCGLWVESQDPRETLLVVDQPLMEYRDQLTRLESDYYPQRYLVRSDSAGLPLFSVLWKDREERFSNIASPHFKYIDRFGDPCPGFLQTDCRLLPVDLTRKDLLFVADAAADFDTHLRRTPDDARMQQSLAQYRILLGRHDEACDLLDQLVERSPTEPFYADLRTRALARRSDLDGLRAEIRRYESLAGHQPDLLDLMRLRAALLADDISESVGLLSSLENRLNSASRRSASLVRNVLRAHALAMQFFDGAHDQAMLVHCEQIAFSLLPEARFTTTLLFDEDFDALRIDDRFQLLLWGEKLGFYAAGAWRDTENHASKSLLGLPAGEHQQESRRLREQGYEPASVAARHADLLDTTYVSSVWRRSFHPPDEQVVLAGQQANQVIALAHLGEYDELLHLLADPRALQARAELFDRMAKTNFAPKRLLQLLTADQPILPRRSLLILLGSFDASAFGPALPRAIAAQVQRLADRAEDASVRSAALWCLRKWGVPSSPRPRPPGNGNWQYAETISQMMITVSPPPQVLIGSPCWEPDRGGSEIQQWRSVDHSFALSATEITVAQFDQFLKDPRILRHYEAMPFEFSAEYAPSGDCPQTSVRYFDAIKFCQWLSEREGIEHEQTCYPDIWNARDGEYEMPEEILSRTGYRLPTEIEWEIACRAETETSRYYGYSDRLLGVYAWGLANADGKTHPVALLIPNDFGFFDMLGNVSEWCQSAYFGNYTSRVDANAEQLLSLDTNRVHRGGSVVSLPRALRTADRAANLPDYKSFPRGFRIARTVPRQDGG